MLQSMFFPTWPVGATQRMQEDSAKGGKVCSARVIFGGGGMALLEHALKVRLVGKAEPVRHVGQVGTLADQLLGRVQAQVDLVGMGRLSEGLLEFSDELEAVQAAGLGQLFQRQVAFHLRMDEVPHRVQVAGVWWHIAILPPRNKRMLL